MIAGRIVDSGSGSEEGALRFSVAANDGTLNTGLTLTGNSSAARADVSISGTLTISTIDAILTDTDKFLVSDGGVVKFVQGATLLPDILTAGTNCTLSGSTLNVDDAFITNNAADIMTVSDFGANAALKIDADQPATAGAEDSVGLWIDYDRIVAGSGTAAHNDIGIDLDVNSASLGTSTVKGMDIDVVGATSGTHTATGIDLNVSGADINVGLDITAPGKHIVLKASNDPGDDYASFEVADTGDLTILTAGDGTTDSDLVLDIDGDINMDAAGGDVNISSAHVKIDATKALYLDGGGDTYITEVSADIVRYYVGGDIAIQMQENGDDGNMVHFPSSSVGFTQLEPTYNATATQVDFRHSNKQNLTFGAGNITHMQLYFPAMSGNFQLLMKQDGTGSRSVTGAWKVYEEDETVATGGSGIVVWAGGSAPTLTTDANHVDILSFYWDDDNQICYGVATLDFQF